MLKNYWRMLLAPTTDNPAPGASAPVPPPPGMSPPAAAGETQYDDLGYEIVKDAPTPPGAAAPEPPAPGTPAPAAKPDDKIATPATGYGDEPEPPAAPAAPVDPATPPEKVSFGEGVEVDPKDVPVDEQKKIAAIATKHKLSKEIIQDYLDTRSAEIKEFNEAQTKAEADAQKATEDAQKKWRADQQAELKNDPTFGGDKYSHNIHRVEKVLDQYMPNVKKVLTERKGMLPSYFMRDLAAMADHLYGTENVVQGDPSAPAKKNEDDALDFYNNP